MNAPSTVVLLLLLGVAVPVQSLQNGLVRYHDVVALADAAALGRALPPLLQGG
jgi:hypothetical protein